MKGLAFYFFVVSRFERLKGSRNKAYGYLRHFLFLVNRVGGKRQRALKGNWELELMQMHCFAFLGTLLLLRMG